jgi:hypothetical protein
MSAVATLTIGGTTAQGTADLPANTAQTNYWSTVPRLAGDNAADVMQLNFRNPRLINAIYIETAHFPHAMVLEYQDPNDSSWRPLQLAKKGGPAGYLVVDSAPAKINVHSNQEHTQHYGPNHWVPVTFALTAVETAAIRFKLTRNPHGTLPRDTAGKPAAFSLGLRNVQIGYDIYSKADAPRYGDPTFYTADFAETTDMLGSPVSFSLTEEKAANVLDSAGGPYWRSEPMPVNFAVVNFYVDVRDPQGNPQTIDRFLIDPLTVGVNTNVYWSTDVPDSNFEASDEPLAYPIVQLQGTSATPQKFPPHPTATQVTFSHVFPSFIDVDNHYLQWDPAKPFWFGFELLDQFVRPDGNTQDPAEHYTDLTHPIFSWGQNVLQTIPGAVRFVNSQNQAGDIPFDPQHQLGSVWRVVLVYNPKPTADYDAGVTLIYQLGDFPAVQQTFAMSPFGVHPGVLRFMGYPDTNNPGIPSRAIRNFILKTNQPQADDIAGYLADSVNYVHRAPYAEDDTHTTDNSILRLDPPLADVVTCPAGLVGGVGDIFEDVTWTPVARDYSLKQGYLDLPPTSARFFKFEFTNLVPETYENFVPINRSFQIFNTTTVQNWEAVAGAKSSRSSNASVPGVASSQALTTGQYVDAVAVLQGMTAASSNHNPTAALVAPDITQAQQIAQTGWIWGFQPWHVGSSAPQFMQTTRHVYETVQVQHTSKVGFFVGIKSLQAFRRSYIVDDDTDQYLEQFTDDTHIASADGVASKPGLITSLGGFCEVISDTFNSTADVRAVQYATQQSANFQVLLDDYFTAADNSPYWQPYGDAVLQPSYGSMRIIRGFYRLTYGDLQVDSSGTHGSIGSVTDSFDPRISDVWAVQSGNPTSLDGIAELPAGASYTVLQTDPDVPLSTVGSSATIFSTGMPLDPAGGDTGVTEAFLDLVAADGTDSMLRIGKTGTSLLCRIRSSGVDVDTSTAWDGDTMMWWRIRNEAGQIYWETSPDGAAWTVQHQVDSTTVGWDLTQVSVRLTAGHTGTVSAPGNWSVQSVNMQAGQQAVYGTYGNLDQLIYAQLEGGQPSGSANGGMRSAPIQPLNGGHLYAAARVTADATLTAPLRLSILSVQTDQILASATKMFYAGQQDFFNVGYIIGSAETPKTYGDIEGDTYGSLQAGVYGDYESTPITGDIYVRLDQPGGTEDNWTVERLSLYDEPVSWSFSVDGGTTWFEAFGVVNNPNGVLTFPVPGNQLRWRLRMYAPGASVSALAIRPWYAGLLRTRPTNTALTVNGPNRSVIDQYPPIESDPMWQAWDQPIPSSWWDPVPAVPPVLAAPITAPGGGGGGGPVGGDPGAGAGGGGGIYHDSYIDTY